ncbi:MAG TPA: sigma factor-like helix-turn-helix DNA-binding protein, partial [Candidatus Polarisedimenticolia bacterium]|nr:sigma factor-like helix-turn-helix DNA-binding protein [Candidatus Polarisedimenticolia bacterium]
EELRTSVILRDLQGLSYSEIAETLKVAVGTVKSRIHRGRLELAQLLMEGRAAGPQAADAEEESGA